VKQGAIPILIVSLLVATTGFRKHPLDLTFGKYRKLSESKRTAIFESLSGENQFNLKAAVKHYVRLNQMAQLDGKTLRQLCAEGVEIRKEIDELEPQY
jgi:hypothetical protein